MTKGRLGPTLVYEDALCHRGIFPVAGVDEAGRGPLAGPVVAAAVILPREFEAKKYGLLGLDDSKRLNPKKRESLFATLTGNKEIFYALGEADAAEIGRLNILRATWLAMKRALEGLQKNGHSPAHVLVDGLPVKGLPVDQTALVGGDGLSMSIAAASILAKVTRDRLMRSLDSEYPQYGFAQHQGYATAHHLAKLREHGPCPFHRRGFAPVDQTTFDL
jgi:ribonuclease HII